MPPAAAKAPSNVGGNKRRRQHVRILLIEDDPETAEYVDQGLKEDGHDLHLAEDGRSGLFRAAGEPWDLLTVDRMLPRLGGLALVKTLRGGGINVPVLFLTTMGGIDDRPPALYAGGSESLVMAFAHA